MVTKRVFALILRDRNTGPSRLLFHYLRSARVGYFKRLFYRKRMRRTF